MLNLKERTSLWYVALLRIYVGYYFLSQGIGKYQRSFPEGDWLGRQIGDIASVDLFPWYRRFLLDYIVPHQEVFGYLLVIGELAVGACLLLGFLARFGAALGLVLSAYYYLGAGMARGGATLALQQLLIFTLIVFLLANPGRAIGLDGWLFGGGRGKGAR